MSQAPQGFIGFISRGQVIDTSIGIVLGGAFTAIVTSFVQDVITPGLGAFSSKPSGVADLFFVLKPGRSGKREYAVAADAAADGAIIMRYGLFVQSTLNFLMQGFALYLLVRAYQEFIRRAGRSPLGSV